MFRPCAAPFRQGEIPTADDVNVLKCGFGEDVTFVTYKKRGKVSTEKHIEAHEKQEET